MTKIRSEQGHVFRRNYKNLRIGRNCTQCFLMRGKAFTPTAFNIQYSYSTMYVKGVGRGARGGGNHHHFWKSTPLVITFILSIEFWKLSSGITLRRYYYTTKEIDRFFLWNGKKMAILFQPCTACNAKVFSVSLKYWGVPKQRVS